METDIEKRCRVCISRSSEMMSIFKYYKFSECNLQIFEVMLKCASVQIQKHDGFSQQICKGCLGHLRQAFSFKQLCEDSDYKFRHNLIDIVSEDLYSDGLSNSENTLLSEAIFIKSEFYEEDTKIENTTSQEKDVPIRVENLIATVTDLQKPINFSNEKLQLCDGEETKVHCTEINDENAKHNISNGVGNKIKSEFYAEETEIQFGVLENQLSEEFNTPLNLTGPLSENSQQNENKKTYNCSVCSKVFYKLRQLKEHRKTHIGEKFYECEICSKRVARKFNLKMHMIKHTRERLFKCDVCPKDFNTAADLRRHQRAHTGEKPFECDMCDRRFAQSCALNVHKLNKHEPAREKSYKCDVCCKGFYTLACLKRHQRVHTGEKPFGCDVCERRFYRECHLKLHMQVHTAKREKPYKCDVCCKDYYTLSDLKRHQMVHTGEKPFGCDICEKRFNRAFNLKLHKQVHK